MPSTVRRNDQGKFELVDEQGKVTGTYATQQEADAAAAKQPGVTGMGSVKPEAPTR